MAGKEERNKEWNVSNSNPKGINRSSERLEGEAWRSVILKKQCQYLVILREDFSGPSLPSTVPTMKTHFLFFIFVYLFIFIYFCMKIIDG